MTTADRIAAITSKFKGTAIPRGVEVTTDWDTFASELLRSRHASLDFGFEPRTGAVVTVQITVSGGIVLGYVRVRMAVEATPARARTLAQLVTILADAVESLEEANG